MAKLSEVILMAAEEERKKKEDKMIEDLRRIKAFEMNPNDFSKDEQMRLALQAHEYGLSEVPEAAAKNDKPADPSASDIAKGMLGGFFDSLLFGVLKNEWYENERNKEWAKWSRLAGDVAGFAIPGMGLGTLAKGVRGVTKGAKIFGLGTKATKAAGAALKGANSMKSMLKIVKGADGATDAIKLVKAAKAADAANDSAKILDAAEALIKTADKATDADKLLDLASALETGATSGMNVGEATKLLKTFKKSEAWRGLGIGTDVGLGTIPAFARAGRTAHSTDKAFQDDYVPPDYTDYRKLLEWFRLMQDLKSGEMNTMMMEQQ